MGLEPYRAEGGDLCEWTPIPEVCRLARTGLTLPFVGSLRPMCLGVRAAWAFWHITVFLVLHAFCITTDAHSVSAACAAGSLERRRDIRFFKGELSCAVLYFMSLACGIQAYRALLALGDWSCVTESIEMEEVNIETLLESEDGVAELQLLVAAVSAPIALVLLIPLIPKDLPVVHCRVAKFLRTWLRGISEKEMVRVEYEWDHCPFVKPQKIQGIPGRPKAARRQTTVSRLATFIANEDSDDEEGFRKLRGRHKCWWFGIDKRVRVYGRIFEAKR